MLKLDIVKNPTQAGQFGATYGQDVEPAGIYVTDLKNYRSNIPEGWKTGTVYLNNPMYIKVTNDTLVKWKYDLAKEYKTTGKRLTNKLKKLGYYAIITL